MAQQPVAYGHCTTAGGDRSSEQVLVYRLPVAVFAVEVATRASRDDIRTGSSMPATRLGGVFDRFPPSGSAAVGKCGIFKGLPGAGSRGGAHSSSTTTAIDGHHRDADHGPPGRQTTGPPTRRGRWGRRSSCTRRTGEAFVKRGTQSGACADQIAVQVVVAVPALVRQGDELVCVGPATRRARSLQRRDIRRRARGPSGRGGRHRPSRACRGP